MKSPHRFAIDVCAIAVYTFLFLWPLGIFGGPVGDFSSFPKGDDAQIHATFLAFFLRNWPYVRWFPYWYGGFPLSLSYQPMANYVWAPFSMLTRSSVEFTLFFFSALSYIVTAVALYLVTYKITRNHNAALLTPILTIASGGFIGTLSAGGAYTRVFSTMLWILAFFFLVIYIKTDGNRKYFIATVVFLSGTITSNMLIGIFAGLTVVVVLLFCMEGWRRRLVQIIKVLVPTVALSAFFYIPFIFSYLSNFVSFGLSGGHYSTPMPLLYLGASGFLPLLYLLISTISVRLLKIKFEGMTSRILNALKVLILFLFLYGFLDWPSSLRFFATYDTTYFLPIYLSIYVGIVFAGIYDKLRLVKPSPGNFQRTLNLRDIMQKGRRIFPVITLLGALILPFFYRPILMSYVVDPGANSWSYPSYAADQLLEIDPNQANFRFSTDWIHVIRWFNYRYSDISQTSGAHETAIPYPNWFSWFDEAVYTTEGNWEETNFLLDWYAVKYMLLGNTISPSGGGTSIRYGLTDKYLSKPEYYENVSMVTVPNGPWAGSLYQFNYEYAKPIMSATNAATLLVTDEPQFYNNLFRSLSYANFNEQYIIPIRSQRYVDEYDLEELKRFSVLFVALDGNYYRNFDKAWGLLRQYVNDGGGLLLEGDSSGLSPIPMPSPINSTRRVNLQGASWNVSIAEHEITNLISLDSFSSPFSEFYYASGNLRPGAQTILWNNNDALVVAEQYGKGRVIWNGLNLSQRTAVSKNQMESFFFSRLIEWVGNIVGKASFKKVISNDSVGDWMMYPGAKETNGSLSVGNDIEDAGSSSLKLGYSFNPLSLQGEDVEYEYSPGNVSDWGDAQFLSFWIYGDNSKNQLKIAILTPNWDDYLQAFLELDWSGWKKIVIPLSKMGGTGAPSLSRVGGVSFVVDETTVGDGLWHWLYLSDIGIVQMNENKTSPIGVFSNPNPEKFVVGVDSSSGVLLKESYFENWYAYLVDGEGQSKSLSIYRAGPDFMHVFIPSDTELPAEVVFEYGRSQTEWLGYFLSIFALFALIVYGLGSRLSAPFLPYLVGDSGGIHGRFGKAYELLRLKPNDFLLDIGCSSGAFLQSLSQKGFRSSIGLDIDKTRVRRSSSELVPVIASAMYLPFRRETFTKVSMLETFEHIPSSLRGRVISEVRSVLESKGECIISVPTKSFFGNLDLGIWFKIHQNVTQPELLTVLNQSRFRVIEKFQAGSIGHLLDLYIYSRKYSLFRLTRIIKAPSDVDKTPVWLLKKLAQEYSVNNRFGATFLVRAEKENIMK